MNRERERVETVVFGDERDRSSGVRKSLSRGNRGFQLDRCTHQTTNG